MKEEKITPGDRWLVLGIGTLLLTAMGSSVFLTKREKKPQEPPSVDRVVSQDYIEHSKGYTGTGISLELFTIGPPKHPVTAWTGAKITLDDSVRKHWATMAPVNISIPEINYNALFHVENGVYQATIRFPEDQYAPVKGRTYHLDITGIDPLTGRERPLLNQVLNPESK